jgi:hypothetical protein
MSVEVGEGVAYHVDTSRYLRHFVARLGLRRWVVRSPKVAHCWGNDATMSINSGQSANHEFRMETTTRLQLLVGCVLVSSSEIMSRSRLRS